MSLLKPSIREVKQDDDFNQICNLILENKRSPMYFPNAPDKIRNWFFSNEKELESRRKGYIAEVGSKIIAFMGLDLRGKNGVVVYGMQESDNVSLLSDLLDKCASVVIERGGNYLYYFSFTEFGQIRNREITLLERLGFRTTDEYLRISTRLSLQDWKIPNENINIDNINAKTIGLDKIYQILIDDDNAPNAAIFKHQFQIIEPSNVILTMRNAQEEITAVAYYKVKKVNENSDILSATAFNLHFRPQFNLSRNEKKQFLQGILYSMKQLGLHTVNSLMSLKNVDTFTLMVREGFDDIQSNFFALSKTVGKEK